MVFDIKFQTTFLNIYFVVVQVFAFNSVGKSEPAVVMVNPTLAKRRTVPSYLEEPEYQPEYPQETLLCKYDLCK